MAAVPTVRLTVNLPIDVDQLLREYLAAHPTETITSVIIAAIRGKVGGEK